MKKLMCFILLTMLLSNTAFAAHERNYTLPTDNNDNFPAITFYDEPELVTDELELAKIWEDIPNNISDKRNQISFHETDSIIPDPRNAVSYDLTTGVETAYAYSDAEGEITENTKELYPESPDILYKENARASNDDTRKKITNPAAYTENIYIVSYFTDEDDNTYKLQGSGAMISNKTILTAGHVVHDSTLGWPFKVVITPGGLDSDEGSLVTRANSLVSVQGWTKDQNRDSDYGIINLTKFLDVDYYSIDSTLSNSQLSKKTVYRYGFPRDKADGTMWRATGDIDLVRTKQFSYTGYSYSGESGGPVIDKTTGDLIGIHIGDGEYSGKPYGLAVRMCKEISDFIDEYGKT